MNNLQQGAILRTTAVDCVANHGRNEFVIAAIAHLTVDTYRNLCRRRTALTSSRTQRTTPLDLPMRSPDSKLEGVSCRRRFLPAAAELVNCTACGEQPLR